MWHSIDNKPTLDGIYVVAQFDGDKMLNLNTNYARAEGYWGPNNIGWCERFPITHWMSYAEYRAILENTPRG